MPSNKNDTFREKISHRTAIQLWTKAGGRCEFPGCNQYLLRDGITMKELNLSNVAHIVAASHDGPRGDYPLDNKLRKNIENLMLVCPIHHKVIDSDEHNEEYPAERLTLYKQQHEARILRLTAFQDDFKTTVLRMTAKIGGQAVSVSPFEVEKAVYPKYRSERDITIDLAQQLSQIEVKNQWDVGCQIIDDCLNRMYDPDLQGNKIEHLSVFAIGPMPLLIYLGSRLSNTISTDFYQLHRSTQSWIWSQDEGEAVQFGWSSIREGKDKQKVVALLSFSGRVDIGVVPDEISEDCSVYEFYPTNYEPSFTLVKRREDMEQFKAQFLGFLENLKGSFPEIKELHIFPALPAPAAVAAGFVRNAKSHPAYIVYEPQGAGNPFTKTITVS